MIVPSRARALPIRPLAILAVMLALAIASQVLLSLRPRPTPLSANNDALPQLPLPAIGEIDSGDGRLIFREAGNRERTGNFLRLKKGLCAVGIARIDSQSSVKNGRKGAAEGRIDNANRDTIGIGGAHADVADLEISLRRVGLVHQ